MGWDPRGTNASTPVKCFDDEETQAFTELDSSPDDPAETEALIVGTWQFAQSCREHSGALLDHISTVDTVRDLDLLRQLVGDEKLTFWGTPTAPRSARTTPTCFPNRSDAWCSTPPSTSPTTTR